MNWWIDETPYPGPVNDDDVIMWVEVDGKKYLMSSFTFAPANGPRVLQNGDTMTFTYITTQITA